MAIYSITRNKLIQWILGSIDYGQEVSLVDGSGTNVWWIYAKKLRSYNLQTSPHNSAFKFMKLQDSNSTFSPTAKSGYKLISWSPDQYRTPDSTPTAQDQIFDTRCDARNQPHDESVTYSHINGSYTWNRAYVPNATNETLAKNNLLNLATGGNFTPQYPDTNDTTHPVYLNDHNWRKPIYNPEHKRERLKWP